MIRYKKLGYVALNVTDLERSNQYYEQIIGLQQVRQGNEEGKNCSFFRFSREHHQIALYQAKEPGLKRICFEVEDDDQLDVAVELLTDAGVTLYEVDQAELKVLHQKRTIRFQEPNSGMWFELYSTMMVLGTEPQVKLTKIERLGHVVISLKKYEEVLSFLTTKMNFKVSDYFGEKFAFLRCHPNPYHHTFAISEGKENVLNHVNFMVSDMDDIGIARNRLLDHDVPIVFGPGRHYPSDSIFLYFLDPDQLTLEYSFGMEEFEEIKPRKPRLLELSKAIGDTWSGKRDPRMGAVGKIEGTD